ncbi:MAG: S8 family peptidase [candidate division WOR-3 bacterium]
MIGTIIFILYSAYITPELEYQLSHAGDKEMLTVICALKTEYPYEAIENLPVKDKIRILKETAAKSQKRLIEYLSSCSEDVKELKSFWIFNGLHITATKRLISKLREWDEIKYLLHDGVIILPGSVINEDFRTPEWNIRRVKADSCWLAGYTGSDVLLGLLDSGCNFTHPALAGKWSGYWKDCVNGQTQPYDDNGHGIFMAGIICGGDGPGPFTNDIGVAPGAKLVVAKVFNAQGVGQYTWIDDGMQWMADLKVDSGVDIRAVSNSWTSGNIYDLHFWNMCRTWKSIGILGIWNIGSTGPGSGTSLAPGNYPLVLGCGAVDSLDYIASFSSRGPAPDTPPWNDTTFWYRRDWNLTKPEIVAPGVNIRSCTGSSGYQTMSGTSLSNPHVAGGVAILCQANPNLTVTELYNLFLDNADSIYYGGYPNNTYGWGRLNLWRTLRAVTGKKENKSEGLKMHISITPNPSPGFIKLSPGGDLLSAVLYDIAGKKVCALKIEKNADIIPLPATIKNGIYFLEVKSKTTRLVHKIILIR